MEKKKQAIQKMFLNIFQEEGISLEELKKGICQSYAAEGFVCETFDDIPIEQMEEAILDCYEAGGLKFNNIDEVLEYNNKKNN